MEPGLTIILFTLDETAYARELAPLAGAYPALLLSAFNPKNLLQATFQQKSSGGLLRRSLVIVQFSASIILMICTVLFYQQLNFIQQQNLGYMPGESGDYKQAGSFEMDFCRGDGKEDDRVERSENEG